MCSFKNVHSPTEKIVAAGRRFIWHSGIFPLLILLWFAGSVRAQSLPPPPVAVPAKVIGHGSIAIKVSQRGSYQDSPVVRTMNGTLDIMPESNKQAVLSFSPAGGTGGGYGINFFANASINLDGYVCTGTYPQECASQQPCHLSVSREVLVQLPIKVSNMSGATTATFFIGDQGAAPTNPTPSPCDETLGVVYAWSPAIKSFPAPSLALDCSKIPTCQSEQKTISDVIGFSAGTPGVPNVTDQYDMKLKICFNDDVDCPTLKIADADSGKVLSDSTTPQSDKVVGQFINLKIQTDPPGQEGNAGDLQWTLPPDPIAIKDYPMKVGSVATLPSWIPLADSDRTNPQLQFYWTVGGSQTVQLSGTVKTSDGLSWPSSASLEYSVARPQMTNFTVFTTIVIFVSPSAANNYQGVMREGGPGKAASFNATVQGVPQAGGNIALLQIAFPGRDAKSLDGPKNIGRAGVDTVGAMPPFYGAAVPIAAGSADIENEDSPSVGFGPAALYVSVHDSFVDYLMYQPTGAKSIWVTLAVASWNWSASWDGTKAAQGDDPDPSPPAESDGADSTQLPTWSSVADPNAPPN